MDKKGIDLSGKKALVTGGSRGLGKAIAGIMAANGAKVVVCSRKKENLEKAQGEFREQGFEIETVAANVGRSGDVDNLFLELDKSLGGLDILVNNVGMNILTPAVAEADEGLWDKTIETNLKGVFLVSRRAVEIMKKQGGGKIINISSIAARKAATGMGLYCVAKAGVEMLTKVLALELARDAIQVNAVAPGMVKTPFSQPFWSNESMLKEITATIPMGRIAEVDDVVGTVMFLASGLSDYITGDIITVDGGTSIT